MSEIQTIIFSKNRACQLELLLRGLNISSTVIYKADHGFENGYNKIVQMYPKVNFVREKVFKEQLIECIDESIKYTLFLVDDDVSLGNFDENCKEFKEFNENKNILCLSLRIGPNHRFGNIPTLDGNKWEWEQYRFNRNYHIRNWGFPMSVTSHIFRTEDILPIIEDNEFKTPNFLEGVLNDNCPNRPLMICLDEPIFINNMANQVQDD
ncbi:MAG: hypothetical protein WC917_01710, partial [Bacilli bacterium]